MVFYLQSFWKRTFMGDQQHRFLMGRKTEWMLLKKSFGVCQKAVHFKGTSQNFVECTESKQNFDVYPCCRFCNHQLGMFQSEPRLASWQPRQRPSLALRWDSACRHLIARRRSSTFNRRATFQRWNRTTCSISTNFWWTSMKKACHQRRERNARSWRCYWRLKMEHHRCVKWVVSPIIWVWAFIHVFLTLYVKTSLVYRF